MECKLKKYDTGYTQVLNDVLYDKTISLRAKGLYAYLFSKPDGWQFHMAVIEKEVLESKGQMYTAIKELIEKGYITRRQINENGVFGGIVYEFIFPDRERKTPCAEIPVYGQTATHNNKDNLNNTDNLNLKEINKEKMENEKIRIETGKFFLDNSMPGYKDVTKGMTDDQCEKLWKYIYDKYLGQELTVWTIRKIIAKFNKENLT